MSDQPSLFDKPDDDDSHARRSDPWTSKRAGRQLPHAGTQAFRLLQVYARAGVQGLTDLDAAERADVRSGWKRCSDLRRLGLIAWDGVTTRVERLGREQMVCCVTPAGRAALLAVAS